MLFFTKIWIAVQPIDRPRSNALDGPPAMDMCAPSSGIDSSILQSFRSLFRASFGGLILFVDILLTVPLMTPGSPLFEGEFNVTQGATISPLALAFLVGYAVDVFYAFLDGLLHKFNSTSASPLPKNAFATSLTSSAVEKPDFDQWNSQHLPSSLAFHYHR